MINFLSTQHLSIISILTFFSIFWFLYNGFIRPTDPKKSHLMGHCLLDIPKRHFQLHWKVPHKNNC